MNTLLSFPKAVSTVACCSTTWHVEVLAAGSQGRRCGRVKMLTKPLYASDFGAVGDGVTDDAAALTLHLLRQSPGRTSAAPR